jgi:bifunctional non-homologous end joining protein LigD
MAATTRGVAGAVRIPDDRNEVELRVGKRTVTLTNLDKVFFPRGGFTKRGLLQYYADVAPVLLPHLRDRAMVMKRYPNGIRGKWFFMKHAPSPRPEWIETCEIMHKSRNLIAFPMVQDLAALLWTINLGCIDLNPWYARCDDTNRPDFLNFDLDPARGATFATARETAMAVRDALEELGMKPMVKTSGSEGLHLYVAIARGPTQKEVWTFAKQLAKRLEKEHPRLMTTEFLVADRPRGRVLVDYNQNAWGRTLASVYSVRPTPGATVSTPVTWNEVAAGVTIDDFRLDNVRPRLAKVGDLWKPLLAARGRTDLDTFLKALR